MRSFLHIICACLALTVSTACAHGPQIQITVDSGKITTRQLLPGNSYSSTNGLTSPASIYVLPVNAVMFGGNPVARVQPISTQLFGPGFTYGYDQVANPGGPHLFAANLELHVAGLKYWDGSSFVATAAGEEQLGMLQASGNVVADSHKTTVGGEVSVPIAISSTYEASGTDPFGQNAHSSMRYQLLGDGLNVNAASRDGIYLVTLGLNGTQASPVLAPSSSFYYILGKNVPFNDLSSVASSFAAAQGIGANLIQYAPSFVPEPTTLAMFTFGAIGFLGLPHRRRRSRG